MGTAFKRGKGGDLDAEGGGGGQWSKTSRRGKDRPKVCRILYLWRFLFTS